MGERKNIFFIYLLTVILAMCSILYELLIAKAISDLLHNTVVWYSLTIGFYLGAMGIAAILYNKFYKMREPWLFLWKIEVILSFLGGLCVIGTYLAFLLSAFLELYAGVPSLRATVFFLCLAFMIVMAIGLLTGFELPLLIRLGNDLSKKTSLTNKILASDYFGSLIGAVAFPLFLLPFLELLTISFVTALLNLLMAVFLIPLLKDFRWKESFRKLNYALVGVLLIGILNTQPIQQYFLRKFYLFSSGENLFAYLKPLNNSLSAVQRYSSFYQKIDFVQYSDYRDPFTPLLLSIYSKKFKEEPQYPRRWWLFLDGKPQFSSDQEEFYHEYFAHVPILVNGSIPQKVLVLGAGDGLLIRELLKYPSIQSITHVEIDKKMIEISKTHPILHYMNKGSLEDKRVKTIIADAYHYLRSTQKKYDAIYMDFPIPIDYNLSKLYSREFYSFVRKHLNPQGYAVLDTPSIALFSRSPTGEWRELEKNPWGIYYHTLKASGFDTIVPFAIFLETDNTEAREAVSRFIEHMEFLEMTKEGTKKLKEVSPGNKEFIVDNILQYVRSKVKEGFIMVKEEKEELFLEYRDWGVKNYVLDGKRFKLALTALPFSFPSQTDPQKVNSIMRPTLPHK